MVNFEDYRCPVCQKAFVQDDDIVVCPECGAPCHRDWFHQLGHCAFEGAGHGSCSWKSSLRLPQKSVRAENHSSTENPASPFSADSTYPSRAPYRQENISGIPPGENIRSVPAGDLARDVGPQASYYIPVFHKISATGKRGRFNFCAFLFGSLWLLFRKQYKLGGILFAVTFVCRTVISYFDYVFSNHVLLGIFAAAGYDYTNPLSATFSQQMAVMEKLSELSAGDALLFWIPRVLELLLIVLSILLGIFANKWYMNHCLNRVKEINLHSSSKEEFNHTLAKNGGVNYPLMICLTVCAIVLNEYSYQILAILFH